MLADTTQEVPPEEALYPYGKSLSLNNRPLPAIFALQAAWHND
jgi:hypothetical protein